MRETIDLIGDYAEAFDAIQALIERVTKPGNYDDVLEIRVFRDGSLLVHRMASPDDTETP